jgi:hypothetical protein
MAVNDSVITLIEDIVSSLRNNGTIISESFSNDILTLELTSLYDLAVNKYIEVGGTNYKIIALDSGASTVDVIASGVTGETIYTVPTPYFWNGTMQMINKRLNGDNDNFSKYPAILLVDVFRTTRITDPTSPYFAEPRVFVAFLKESLIDYGSDLQNPIINEMQELAEDFISACQANPFIGRFDEFEITRHANFGVYATDRGHISTIIDEQLSGVVVEVTLPIYENFEDCNGNILTAIKCAPGLIKDIDGNLIQELPAGQTYVVSGGGGDVEIYDTDNNVLYTVTAPDSQTITNSTAVLKDTNGGTLSTTSILAQASKDITAPDGNIQLNSVAMTTVLSGGTENIQVRQSSGATQVGSKQGQHWRIADADIENSDQSYTSTVKAEGTLVLPDINFTDSDGTTTSVPSVQDLVCTPSATPSGIAYQRPSLTGQLTSYANYDDAWHLANGTYDYTPPSYPTAIARLDSTHANPFLNLAENNVFGNTNRFTDELGTQVYANNYVVDHLTGLGIYIIVQSSEKWANSLSTANGSSFLSFNDWRIPNFNEMAILFNQQVTTGDGLNYAPLNINFATHNRLWVSSTIFNTTTRAFTVLDPTTFSLNSITNAGDTKTNNNKYIIIRNHYT